MGERLTLSAGSDQCPSAMGFAPVSRSFQLTQSGVLGLPCEDRLGLLVERG